MCLVFFLLFAVSVRVNYIFFFVNCPHESEYIYLIFFFHGLMILFFLLQSFERMYIKYLET